MKTIRLLILSFLVFFLPSSTFSQVFQTYQKTIGGNNDDRGYAMQQTTDGGFIIAGYTKSFGLPKKNFYLVKTDAAGNTVWTEAIFNNEDSEAKSVQQTSDGGYILCGYIKDIGAGDRDVFLVKTDANGTLIWSKTYGNTKKDEGYDVQQTNDGGYIITGYTDETAGGGGKKDVYLIKTDPTGNLIWNRHFGGNDEDEAYSVQQTSDNGYILCGYTKSYGAGDEDIYVIKTDSSGNIQFTKTYGGGNKERAKSIKQTIDGGYILTGYTESYGAGNKDIIILKLSSFLNIQWVKTYGGGNEDTGEEIQILNGNTGYVLTGVTKSFGSGAEDAYLLNTDVNGVRRWSNAYGQNNKQEGYSCVQTANGFALTGYDDNGGAGNKDVYLVKTDSAGFVGCDETPFIPIMTIPAPATTSGSDVDSLCIVTNVNPNSIFPPSIFSTICFNCTLLSSYTQTNVSCKGWNNGTATITPFGGIAPYTYSWLPTGFTGATDTTLTAGTYYVTTTDAVGCISNDTIIITEPALTLSLTNTLLQNVSCYGGNDGVGDVQAAGGTAPYQYSWNTIPQQDTNLVTNLTAGNYIASVVDSHNCLVSIPITITQPPPLTSTITPTHVSCNGGNDGIASAAVTGGTAPYSYNWIPYGGTSNIATNLAAGTFYVVITDNNGCQLNDTIIITEPTILSATVTQTSASCFGVSDGTATVTATGGTPGYTFNWSTGGASSIENNLAAGNHSVTVTDFNGCQVIVPYTISQPAQIIITPTITNSTCGLSDGQVTTSVTGGNSPYTYSWNTNPIQTTATAFNLSAGAYTVTVTDSNSCSQNLTVNVNDVGGPSITITSFTDVSCNGGNDGTANSSISGGTPPYNYNWSPVGGTSPNATTLPAGIASVTVTDTNGCTSSQNVTINEPTPLTGSISKTDVSCNGGTDGTAAVSINGGTPPYTYSWSPSGGSNATATGLIAGNYTCTITDAKGCIIQKNITVNEPLVLSSSVISVTNVSCNGGNDGSATVTGIDGTSGYTYNWVPYGGTSPTAFGLIAGNYMVSITDANGCQVIQPVNISEPPALGLTITSVNPSCFGGTDGSLTANVTSGTNPYSYFWNPNGGTTPTINNLAAGNYSVVVSDANGCQQTLNASLTNPTAISLTTTATTVTCNGGNNGTATVNPSGGTPSYSYSWNTSPVQTTATATGLIAGNYNVIVTDANNCTSQATVNVTESAPININVLTQTDVSCTGGNDGSASISVGGGSAPFIYNWIPTGGNGASANNLVAGNYTVVVTDAVGCVNSANILISEPSNGLSLSVSLNHVSCNGFNDGSASATVNGGTPGYVYSWSPGGGVTSSVSNLAAGPHSVTITDANGCSIDTTITITEPAPLGLTTSNTSSSCGNNDGGACVTVNGGIPPYTYQWNDPNLQTTACATNLPANSYNVTVTDSIGCSATTTVNVNDTLGPNVSVTVNSSASCNGGNDGSATATVSGGQSPYSYSWSPNGGTNSSTNNLDAGTHTVTVTDSNGCVSSASTIITEPSPITLTVLSQTDLSCYGFNDGTASVNANGGVPGYNYQWSPSGNTGPNANGLQAGVHTILVTDANGCQHTDSLTINEPSQIIPSTTNINNTCNGGNDGSITVSVTGGFGPYTYSWSPSGGSNPTATNLAAGTYNVLITDANGCQASTFDVVTQPLALNLSLSSSDPSCNGFNDGVGSVTVNGGTPGYSYSWSPNGGTTSMVNNLGTGVHTVTVTDGNGCTINGSITINNPTAMTASTTQSDVSCNGGADGTATVNVNGGSSPYIYNWSPSGGNNSTASGLTAGNYTVTATDNNGCMLNTSLVITEPSNLNLAVVSNIPVSCNGACDGSAQVTASGGTAPYTYLWQPGGQSSATVNNLCAGNHTVIVTDANNCTDSIIISIAEPNALSLAISTSNISCGEACDGSATVVTIGGTGPYSILWSPGLQTTPTATGLCDGNYSVTVTDANGCSTTSNTSIVEPTPLGLTTSSTASTCGNNDGSACVNVTGGIAPYTYSWNDPGLQTTSCATNLSANSYTVSVTDSSGCVDTAVVNVNDVTGPTVVITASTNVTCNGANNGTATANVSGGVNPYDILWSPSGQTSSFAGNLSAGNHTITVTDASGCVSSASVIITEPTAVNSGFTSVIDNTCNLQCNGSATVAVGGGISPYSYSWNTSPTQTTATANNLCAGNYTVLITDSNGCMDTNNITITEPSPLLINTINVTDAQCNGSSNGSIQINVTGGTPSYTYSWTPFVGSGPFVSNLAAGNYAVTVTDVNGCTSSQNFTIDEPTPLNLATSSVSAFCGLNNGSASAFVSGGVAPYTYLWNDPNNQTGSTATNLYAGIYTVAVTDANNCMISDTANVAGNNFFFLDSITQTPAICNNTSTGSAQVYVTSGSTPYTYQWNDPSNQTTPIAVGLFAGTYTVIVTDASGCVDSLSITVEEPSPLQVVISSTFDTICPGQSSQLFGNGAGGTAPYQYNWSPIAVTGPGPHTVSPAVSTTYTLFVSDANGCVSQIVNKTIIVNPPLNIVANDQTVCDGDTVTVSANVTGSSGGPYIYSWSNGPTTASQIYTGNINQSPDTLIISVSDACVATPSYDTVIVTVTSSPDIDFDVINSNGCTPLTVNFNGISSNGMIFNWDFGDLTGVGDTISPSHVYTKPGTYNVTLSVISANGCSSSLTKTNAVEVYPLPTAAFQSNPVLVELPNSTVNFNNISSNAVSYLWNFGDGGNSTDFEPSYFYIALGTYNVELIATNIYNCSDTAFGLIEVTGDALFPTAFTPNQGGSNGGTYNIFSLTNDVFFPFITGVKEYELMIFNRWGELIFKTNDVNVGWDGYYKGVIAQQGVYIWKANIVFENGRTYNGSGDVTLLR